MDYLEFERPIAELEQKIDELRRVGNNQDINLSEEIVRLENKSKALTRAVFNSLTAQQNRTIGSTPPATICS